MKSIIEQKFDKAVLPGYLTPTVSTPFYTTQYEYWDGQITSVASQTTSFAIKVKATPEARLKYNLSSNIDLLAIFSIPWNTDQATVAADLATAINAANGDANSPLYGLISSSDSSGGAFNIEGLVGYVNFEIMTSFGVDFTPGIEGYNMETDLREAVLKATVRSAPISYLEVGGDANSANGRLVEVGKSFEIYGRENIMSARVIDVSSASSINYTIYVQE